MSHPAHAELLAHIFDLGDRATGEHVQTCSVCRLTCDDLHRREAALLTGLRAPHVMPRQSRHPMSPISILGASLIGAVGAAVLSGGEASLLPLAAGAAALVVWLHVVLARFDRIWSHAEACLEGVDVAAAPGPWSFAVGVRLALVETVRQQARDVRALLRAIGLVLFLSLVTVGAGWLTAPAATADVVVSALGLPFAAAIAGTLLAGVGAAVWRVRGVLRRARLLIRRWEGMTPLAS